MPENVKKFIIWDTKDGDAPRRSDINPDEIISAGLVGVIEEENAFLSMYAKWCVDRWGTQRAIHNGVRQEPVTHRELDVNKFTWAEFSLSGSRGVYQVWRVA